MSKRSLTLIIALLAVLVLSMALNPSGERHRTALREAVAERSPIAGALGLGALTSLVTEYHSIGIASYTVLDDYVMTVGALGLVHVVRTSTPDKK
jgi:hypothetical protein